AEQLSLYATERLCTVLGATGNSRRAPRIAQLETDQLAVLFEDVADRAAQSKAAALVNRTLAKRIELDGRQYALKPLMGVAMFPQDGGEPETLIDSARAAILAAQREGGADPSVGPCDSGLIPIVARQDLERELQWAIEHEQFALRYVPVVELSGRTTV